MIYQWLKTKIHILLLKSHKNFPIDCDKKLRLEAKMFGIFKSQYDVKLFSKVNIATDREDQIGSSTLNVTKVDMTHHSQ